MTADILIIDDEEDIRNLVRGILEDEGYATRTAAGSASAFEQIKKKTPDLIILDVWLQGSEKDGLQILKSVKNDHPHVPVIMISGHGTIETAVAAIKDGAYDFIEKPFKTDRLLTMMTRALEAADLKRENFALKQKSDAPAAMVAHSAAAGELKALIEKVAPTNSRIMIFGEPGSGKESVARQIHAGSARAKAPFVTINAAHLSAENFDPECKAAMERARGGTILIYEVTDIPADMQGRFVKLLQDTAQDVRFLSCTRRNIQDDIREGRFREDLFYRLNVVSVQIPALRERVQDIPELAQQFVDKFAQEAGRTSPPPLAESALSALRAYVWPGNIRQLKNEMERAVILAGDKSERIERAHLSPDIIGEHALIAGANDGDDYLSLPLREAREAFERKYLQAQMIRFDGSVSDTSRFIGMERSALHRKLKALGITGGDKGDADEDAAAAEESDRKRA
jgi:two-component system nitrogen regulation response regulator NtrX